MSPDGPFEPAGAGRAGPAAPIDRAALLVADLERLPDLFRRLAGRLQSGWLEARLAADGWPVARVPRRVVLTGLGSSRFAALAVAPCFLEAGLDVIVEHASSARPAPVGAGTLVVGISASGGTPETVAALARARAGGAATLAVTNRTDSDLTRAAAAALALDADEEASGIASLTFGATVGVLLGLAGALGAPFDPAGALGTASAATDELLETRGTWLRPAADALAGGATIHVLADAGRLGTAEQAALMFREGPRLEADATDAGDWLHVGLYTALPGCRALLLAGTVYDDRIAGVLAERGGRFVACGAVAGAAAEVRLPAPADVDPWVRALVEPAIPALLAAELWRRTRAADVTSGR